MQFFKKVLTIVAMPRHSQDSFQSVGRHKFRIKITNYDDKESYNGLKFKI